MIKKLAIFLGVILGIPATPVFAANTPHNDQDLVILVHGLARSSTAMWLLEYRLEAAGYNTCAINYPSLGEPPEEILTVISNEIERCQRRHLESPQTHFVTHSLGGPLIRAYLSAHHLSKLGRVVMLSPPNHGSDLVERFGDWEISRYFLGPTGLSLTSDHTSWLARKYKTPYDIGIIAGNFTFNPLAAYFLDGRDDGAVSIEDMKLPHMTDFMEVSATHVTIRYSLVAADQTRHFLKNGQFDYPR